MLVAEKLFLFILSKIFGTRFFVVKKGYENENESVKLVI